MTYGLSNGHVTNDVTWPLKVLLESTVGYSSDSLASCFSRVLHNENHVLHPLLPERNYHGYELRRRRHERGLFLRPTMPNAILYTDSYINISLGTNFSARQLIV